LFGHSGSQAPQLIHSSVIIIAILFLLIIIDYKSSKKFLKSVEF
jgi:hypothetical protein